MTEALNITKRQLHEGLISLCEGGTVGISKAADLLYHPDVYLRASHPMNEAHGVESLISTLWAPLFASFPDVERRDSLVVSGQYEGRDYIGMVGHYCGTFQSDWLGIPATGRPIYLRYGEVHEVRDGKIIQSNCIWDVLDVIRQTGFCALAPSLGTEGMWPGPLTGDGLDFSPRDAQKEAFRSQLDIAADTGKPVFLHQRDAHDDFVNILEPALPKISRAVAHCFTGEGESMREYLAMGLWIGITGWICDERRGGHLREIVAEIPDNRLLIETDAPYLLPRTLKPKPKSRRCEPAHLTEVLKVVAKARGQSEEHVADITTANAIEFFALP